MPKRKSPALKEQAYHAIIAFFVFLGIMALSQGPFQASIMEWGRARAATAIVVEHVSPATITLAISSRGEHSIAEWKNESDQEIFVNLPEDWIRREVRGATLEQVAAADAGLGFVRWTLPPAATISLSAPTSVPRLILHHQSETPLKVEWTRVDVDTGEVLHDIVLIQKESAEVW